MSQHFESRGRQSGKTNDIAVKVAAMTGLQHATVMDLLRTGWTYTERLRGEQTWTRG